MESKSLLLVLVESVTVFLVSTYGAPLAHSVYYFALHSSLCLMTQLNMIILSLMALTVLIGSKFIPNGVHNNCWANLGHTSKHIKISDVKPHESINVIIIFAVWPQDTQGIMKWYCIYVVCMVCSKLQQVYNILTINAVNGIKFRNQTTLKVHTNSSGTLNKLIGKKKGSFLQSYFAYYPTN